MFSVLSWNVEHFKGGTSRVKNVVKHIYVRIGRDPRVNRGRLKRFPTVTTREV